VKEIYYTYNNEAIASCAMIQALNEVQSIDIARSCLLLPFLLDDRTVTQLQTVKDAGLSLGDFIQSRPRLFSSFNKRYTTLLPITINALMILSKGGLVGISKHVSLKKNILSDTIEIGDRFNEIKKALPVLMKMIAGHETTKLYQLLKIQL
jgi:hypothetical protein